MGQSHCCAYLDQKVSASSQSVEGQFLGRKAVLLGLKIHLARLGEAVARGFRLSKEPVISKQQDRQGDFYYRVYDPYHRSHHTFRAENEVRIWLEERHYR
ncbi:hypothetical protein XM38_042040 [Halomicronema hongdechloris C2206]|uniref:Uncharacterized protein n=1 Tax=Halomicronema hongdechloris C2206 TaxID=1641165 RepID=A0A1Z3HSL3_9CYAN|nr:hypothetical protein [Halomicronema hongdechloris]ASC73242.1 hypothetical protein XM38_042040 [Halomicronema hongdechloris C2206]